MAISKKNTNQVSQQYIYKRVNDNDITFYRSTYALLNLIFFDLMGFTNAASLFFNSSNIYTFSRSTNKT